VESLIRWSCEDIKRQMDIHFKDKPGTPVPPALAADMHAALFAAGDCFGPTGAEDGARRLRTALDPTLRDLLRKSRSDKSLIRVGRAAAYAIAVTAQPGDDSKNLLGLLADHDDRAVVRLGKWALRRFDDQGDGGIHPPAPPDVLSETPPRGGPVVDGTMPRLRPARRAAGRTVH